VSRTHLTEKCSEPLPLSWNRSLLCRAAFFGGEPDPPHRKMLRAASTFVESTLFFVVPHFLAANLTEKCSGAHERPGHPEEQECLPRQQSSSLCSLDVSKKGFVEGNLGESGPAHYALCTASPEPPGSTGNLTFLQCRPRVRADQRVRCQFTLCTAGGVQEPSVIAGFGQ
jgi:hypothetical protein